MFKRLTAFFAVLLIAGFPMFSQAKDTGKKTIFEEISWEALMPPVDEAVVKKYEAGEMDREDVMDYMETLGNTPVKTLDKSQVKIPGFLVPLNLDKNQMATELLLVPTLGACVHTPPPPPNQTIYVRYDKGIKVTEAGYTPYWIEGTINVEKNTSQYTDTLYGLNVSTIVEYE
ncbi:DUF3299 domain-containing protein [Parendozoicomonas sp. Alg238-R29]|uniref:DUF3299 domain-containing protein n=1 Tax=Parendozoicomonas sp. Alg238-R29 TaxID=2993446 RepID=UPI00248D715F|nr:DUF3299 domain-containing protein [Parendozoicomonas sp. Alg238-R29]